MLASSLAALDRFWRRSDCLKYIFRDIVFQNTWEKPLLLFQQAVLTDFSVNDSFYSQAAAVRAKFDFVVPVSYI